MHQRQGYTESPRQLKATTLPFAFLSCDRANRWGVWMSGENKALHKKHSCLTRIAALTADTVSNAVIIAGFED